MKIDRLETHDRYKHFIKDQEYIITQGIEECRTKNPDSLLLQSKSPYIYIFAHPRTNDDGVTKTMYWQPRLSRPAPQTNSYLFRLESNTDIVEVCWLLPPRELWEQYKKGKVTESDWVLWSIDQFTNNYEELSRPYPDDFSEPQVRDILRTIAMEIDQDNRMKSLYVMPNFSEGFSSV